MAIDEALNCILSGAMYYSIDQYEGVHYCSYHKECPFQSEDKYLFYLSKTKEEIMIPKCLFRERMTEWYKKGVKA